MEGGGERWREITKRWRKVVGNEERWKEMEEDRRMEGEKKNKGVPR